MKPHKPTARSKSAGLAAARTVMRERLGWLRGFPVGGGGPGAVRWWCVPAPGEMGEGAEVEIGPRELRRATKGAEELFRRFPRALPALVGDREVWHSRVRQLLETLKGPVHGRRGSSDVATAVPGDLAPRVAKMVADLRPRNREVRRLVDALIWVHFLDADQGWAMVRAVARDGARWEELVLRRPGAEGLALALKVLELRVAEGAERSGHLLELLAQSRTWETSLGARHEKVELAASRQRRVRRVFGTSAVFARWTPAPGAVLGPEIARLVPRLLAAETASRRQMLGLLELVLPPVLIDLWEGWWKRHDRYVGELERRLRRDGEDAAARRALRRLHGQKLRLAGRTPPAIDAAALGRLFEKVLGETDARFRRQMLGILPQLPSAHRSLAPRVDLLTHWTALHGRMARGAPPLTVWLKCFDTYVQEQPVPMAALAPWFELLGPHESYRTTPEAVLDDHPKLSTANIPRFFDLLRTLLKRFPRDLTSRLKDHWRPFGVMGHIVERVPDPEVAAGMVTGLLEARLLASAASLDARTLDALILQSAGEVEKLVGLVRAVEELDFDRDEYLDHALRRGLAEPGSGELITALLLDRHVAAVESLLSVSWGLLRLGESPPSPRAPEDAAQSDRASTWQERYPDEYRDLLGALQVVDPRARQAAAKVLGAHFPDRDALREQIARLDSKMAKATGPRIEVLRARRDALRRRCTARDGVTPQRRENLVQRLERRLRSARLQAWDAELRTRLRDALAERLGFEASAEWISDSRRVTLLAHLVSLDKRFRTLAIRLLDVRRGPRPWDLRDAPRNRDFLERMRQRGLALEPWLDGIGPRVHEITGGGALHLELEDDPFQVFLMGAHFKTCLSPGAFNFFSVVANAADVNKRVLYARDGRGEIQGRCLLALTRQGRMVLFNAYAHDPGLGFSRHAQSFAEELAAAMHTTVDPVGEGEVETLLAPEWYDDGAVDLLGSIAALEEGSAFRGAIAGAAAATFIEDAAAVFAPRPLNEATLPLLLRLPEIDGRPDLAALLLEKVEQWEALPDEVLFRAYRITRAAWPAAVPRPILERRLSEAIRRHLGEPWWLPDRDFLALLGELAKPTALLSALRQTRDREVRSWSHEVEPARLLIAALAHDALGRPKVALDLYQRAARQRDRLGDWLRQCIEERIHVLRVHGVRAALKLTAFVAGR